MPSLTPTPSVEQIVAITTQGARDGAGGGWALRTVRRDVRTAVIGSHGRRGHDRTGRGDTVAVRGMGGLGPTSQNTTPIPHTAEVPEDQA